MDIPIIDFASCGLDIKVPTSEALDSVGFSLVKAFANVGFAYVKNAGIPESKVLEVHRTMKEFYLLDRETKAEYGLDECYHGYVSLAGESVNTDRPGDLKETYSVVNLERPNVKFPDEHVQGFSDAWKDVYELCRQLALRVLDLLNRGLKIKDREYLRRCHSRLNGHDNYTALRALYYPPIPEDANIKENQIRLGEHSDYGSFTFLFQDEIGGLEVENLEQKFIEAKPIPGTILVNIGDSLQFWTQGRLKSTRHRVMIPKDGRRGMPRQSIAYFVLPDHEAELTGIEYESDAIQSTKVWTVKHDKTYTAKEYLEMRLKATTY